jgi:hypothetical protein
VKEADNDPIDGGYAAKAKEMRTNNNIPVPSSKFDQQTSDRSSKCKSMVLFETF